MFTPITLSEFRTDGTPAELATHHEAELSAKLLALDYLKYPDYERGWIVSSNNSVSKQKIDETGIDEWDENPKVAHIVDRFESTMNSFLRVVLIDFVTYVNLMLAHGYLTERQRDAVLPYQEWIDAEFGDANLPEAKFIFS